ncbi:Hypothetical predicted protein [Olea europaea subsp. europaea]|uniref:Uncharacterized protein n=1 Tax=Olea europaea subsp. europaea TaxID=158383 RepID=A0A8S0T5D9_OLEEU|nr:Hypothetical predicted protein [Olea europaea subsp. europaea]
MEKSGGAATSVAQWDAISATTSAIGPMIALPISIPIPILSREKKIEGFLPAAVLAVTCMPLVPPIARFQRRCSGEKEIKGFIRAAKNLSFPPVDTSPSHLHGLIEKSRLVCGWNAIFD